MSILFKNQKETVEMKVLEYLTLTEHMESKDRKTIA